ncbi:MAG: flagellar basal-body rod protein FlgF [Marinagarivorans sp.]|nr:flagellar basal-body rod protein FlgF [Marinagarivorans sp.]
MDKALYIAMTGAKHNMLAQTASANNLANINTNGFKSDFATARSMGVYHGDGLPTRAFSMTERPATNLAHGALDLTGNDLDLAIEGDGFFAVQSSSGDEAYTRSGNFVVDQLGMLRTGNGLPVMGNAGPISVPPNSKVEIGMDGSVAVVVLGQSVDAPVTVDRIKLINPDVKTLSKSEDGLFRNLDDPKPIEADGGVRVVSGFLEASNVNSVNELTNMLTLARQYEMHVKMMATAKENSESSSRLIQFNN